MTVRHTHTARCVAGGLIRSLVMLGCASALAQTFSGGSGTAANPYEIATLTDLQTLSATPAVWNAHFIQTATLDASATSGWNDGAGWVPIGNDTTRFIGFYDGQGYEIQNLTLNRPDTPNVGLFGHVGDNTATTYIQNLGIRNASVTGARGTGSLIGRVTGNFNTRVMACYAVNCTVVGDGATGGLIGSFNSYLDNMSNADGHRPRLIRCHASASVSLSSKPTAGKDKFGGLAGCLQKGYAQDCFARGTVTVPGGNRVGGLAGCIEFRGRIERSYSTTSVSGEGASNMGGLIGFDSGSSSEATASFWDTEASGRTTSPYGTGLTTTAMKTGSTFTNAGWDFVGETNNGTDDIWQIDAAINDGYPMLRYAETPVHKIPQEAILFAPDSPQRYATTNSLVFSGGSGTGSVTLSVVQGPGIIVNGDQLVATAGFGTIHVRVQKAEDATYLMASSTAYVETEPFPLTIAGITIADKTFDGTTTATAIGTPILVGVIDGDTVSLGGSPVYAFASSGPGENIAVTVSGLTLQGADAANYTLEMPALSATILSGPPTRIRIR